MNQINTSAANQVQQLTAQLNAALLRKEILTEQLEAVTEQVKALRNVIGGIDLGRNLQTEIAEEQAAKEAKTEVADPRPVPSPVPG